MERKLQDLKEEFCKWHCPNKDYDSERIFELCYDCQVDEYICYIRDQLK